MDPQATLVELLDLASDGRECDIDEIQDRALALLEWHEKGGFLPDLKQALDTILKSWKRS